MEYYSPNNPQAYNLAATGNNPKLGLRIIVLGIVLVLLGVFYFAYSYAFLEIKINDHNGETASYFVDGKETKTNEGRIKKFIKRSDHEVLVKQGTKNSVNTVRSGGFFSTTTVNVDLQSEKSRQFVGDNPGSCFDYLQNVLASWQCSSNFETGNIHKPATNILPSLNQPFSVYGYSGMSLIGFMTQKDKTFALVRLEYDGGNQMAMYEFNQKTGVLDSTKGSQLSDIPADKSYDIKPFRGGYLVYSHDGLNVYHFDKLDGSYRTIDLPRPENQDLGLYSVSTHEDSILITYGNAEVRELGNTTMFKSYSAEDENLSTDGQVNKSAVEGAKNSEVIIVSNDQTRKFKLRQPATQLRLCGDNYLCVLHEAKLSVYEMSDNKLRKNYEVEAVQQIESLGGNELLFVKKDGLAKFNVADRRGNHEFMFGRYSFCGVKVLNNEYLLCLNNPGQSNRRQSVLLVNRKEPVNSVIDHQILELMDLSEIKTLSIYKNFIHISPELGELEYNQKTRDFEHNPERIKQVNSVINNKLDEVRLDRQRYTIVNPYDN